MRVMLKGMKTAIDKKNWEKTEQDLEPKDHL